LRKAQPAVRLAPHFRKTWLLLIVPAYYPKEDSSKFRKPQPTNISQKVIFTQGGETAVSLRKANYA